MEYYWDVLKVVNLKSKIDSTSFAIPGSNSPRQCSLSLNLDLMGDFQGWSHEHKFTMGRCARTVENHPCIVPSQH